MENHERTQAGDMVHGGVWCQWCLGSSWWESTSEEKAGNPHMEKEEPNKV